MANSSVDLTGIHLTLQYIQQIRNSVLQKYHITQFHFRHFVFPFYKKIKKNGNSVNYDVAFLQAKALTMKTSLGRETTIILLQNSPVPLRSLVPFLILLNS